MHQRPPQLTSAPGIANTTAAELLLLVGDNPERIRSEGALAKLCGACPIPASSGMKWAGEFTLFQPCQAQFQRSRGNNCALYRAEPSDDGPHFPAVKANRQQARITLGQEEAITVLAAICARHTAGKVHSPDGLLRRMVELHQTGELRLDRTLFGLADKVRKEAGAAGASRPGQT